MRITAAAPNAEQIAALQAAGLPIDDFENSVPRLWWQAAQGDAWIGIIALERHGNVGLLRSLLVRQDGRRYGIGRDLVAAVESAAASVGLDALYLLTTDAEGYFAKLDYATVERAEVPDAVRATAQFSCLCPASAIVMRKRLAP
jgi:amino-acid N-acetyltransferase